MKAYSRLQLQERAFLPKAHFADKTFFRFSLLLVQNYCSTKGHRYSRKLAFQVFIIQSLITPAILKSQRVAPSVDGSLDISENTTSSIARSPLTVSTLMLGCVVTNQLGLLTSQYT